MEDVKHVLAVDNLIEAIEDEIELAEGHLERAIEFAHHPELAAMFIKCAEASHSRGEELYSHGHKHHEVMKAMGEQPEHKMACGLWLAEHPELAADIDELKFKIHSHKARSVGNPRRY